MTAQLGKTTGKVMKNIAVLSMISLSTLFGSAANTAPQDSANLMMACAFGSFLSAMYAWRKARADEQENTDALINVIIALVGGMSLGYFATPWAQSVAPSLGAPLIGWGLALSGSVFIEWAMGGGIAQFISRRFGDRK